MKKTILSLIALMAFGTAAFSSNISDDKQTSAASYYPETMDAFGIMEVGIPEKAAIEMSEEPMGAVMEAPMEAAPAIPETNQAPSEKGTSAPAGATAAGATMEARARVEAAKAANAKIATMDIVGAAQELPGMMGEPAGFGDMGGEASSAMDFDF